MIYSFIVYRLATYVKQNVKGTYAYDKLIDALCRMVSSNGYDSFILGGDWKVPVVEGLQPANYIQAQETGNSMDEIGFEREYKHILYSINIMNCWKILVKIISSQLS